MIFIKKASDQVKGKHYQSLKHYLHSTLPEYREKRSHKRVHASEVTKEDHEFCAREYALLDIYPQTKRKGDFIGTSLKYTFDMGEILAEKMTTQWALNISVGDWKCLLCGRLHEMCTYPGKCDACGKWDRFDYHEIRVTSQYSGISCGLDHIIQIGPPGSKFTLVELKTIKAEDFKKLKAPKAEHRIRTNLYLRCIEESDHPIKSRLDTSKALIFYMAKGFGFKDESLKELPNVKDSPFSPFKEYWVKYTPEAVDPYVEESRKLWLYRQADGPMPSGICTNQFCKRAQSCPVNQHCFSGKH